MRMRAAIGCAHSREDHVVVLDDHRVDVAVRVDAVVLAAAADARYLVSEGVADRGGYVTAACCGR